LLTRALHYLGACVGTIGSDSAGAGGVTSYVAGMTVERS
jgi:hypothetical protein